MTTPTFHHVYTGRTTNWIALGLTIALAVPLILMGQQSGGSWADVGFLIPVLVVVAAIAVNLVTSSSVRTTAGPQGVTVHFGAFGWPRFRYAAEQIARAEAIEVLPAMWTWGMYWTPTKGLMLTLKGGPALRLSLTNGRKITISTPNPEDAVAALQRNTNA
ncbi:MAG: hypothetical protein JWM34_347 [Ilumatobacteraceae bacterium]|nr:hypothetical protein [Ilumatobacteraceae bacterium]